MPVAEFVSFVHRNSTLSKLFVSSMTQHCLSNKDVSKLLCKDQQAEKLLFFRQFSKLKFLNVWKTATRHKQALP